MDDLEKILNEREIDELLFNNKYRLKYIYSFWGYVKLIFGMTAIPQKIFVYDKLNNKRIGTVTKDDRLFKLAF